MSTFKDDLVLWLRARGMQATWGIPELVNEAVRLHHLHMPKPEHCAVSAADHCALRDGEASDR